MEKTDKDYFREQISLERCNNGSKYHVFKFIIYEHELNSILKYEFKDENEFKDEYCREYCKEIERNKQDELNNYIKEHFKASPKRGDLIEFESPIYEYFIYENN